jgi:hypothetical protein
MPYFGLTRLALGAGAEGGLIVAPFTAALDLATTVPGTAASRALQTVGLPKEAAKALGIAIGTVGAGTVLAGLYYLGEKELDKRTDTQLPKTFDKKA